MADEHVLRIEFQGDDNNNRSSANRPDNDEGRQRQSDSRVNEAYEEARQRQARQDQIDEELLRQANSASDDPLNAGPAGGPEMEWVDESPTYSTSRALTVYDPAVAAAGQAAAGTTTEYGASTVAAGAGGGGGSAAAAGSTVAAEATAGGLVASLAAIVPIAGEVALGLIAVSGAAVAAYEALDMIANALLAEFEQLSPALASARAQQEAELTIYRQQVAPSGGAEIISAQTEVEKALIDIKAHLIETLGPTIIYLAKAVTMVFKVLDFGLQILIWIQWFLLFAWTTFLKSFAVLEHVPIIGTYIKQVRDTAQKALELLEDDPNAKPDPFQREAELFLDSMGANRRTNSRPSVSGAVRRPKTVSRRRRNANP